MNYFEKTLNHLRLFGGTYALGLSLPTKDNARKWLERIENELSPENLCCDGELRGAPLRAKERELLAAQKHCQSLLGLTGDNRFADQFSVRPAVHPFDTALRVANRHFRAKRNSERRQKLHQAVMTGFTIGKRVILSNGHRGKIVKINTTRVKVQTDDNRMWSVPPRCMTLERAGR